jgi:hypothetical protein
MLWDQGHLLVYDEIFETKLCLKSHNKIAKSAEQLPYMHSLTAFFFVCALFLLCYFCSPESIIHLSVVACGDRLEETLTMIKSAVLFTKTHILLHIFADDALQTEFRQQVNN